ncbi:MAG TPA: hypothetical protein VMA32_02230 [Streptosporangiaceae bacterium]|nr:hypothetical protein [Streptosporangiaceae bacterium]
MGNPGAIATNFYQGTRSEYLAQYVFSMFGTAAQVPHEADVGFDLACTLTRTAWPCHSEMASLRIWTSEAEPGHVHDITAARAHALPLLYRAAASGMPALADGGCDGAGIGIHVPVKNPGGN